MSKTSQIIESISKARLQSYSAATNNDATKAIALYEWNLQLCSALWMPLGIVEVSLRNTLDRQLRNTHEFGGNNWWKDSKFLNLIGAGAAYKLTEAARFSSRAKTLNTDAVVSQLNFGFWAGLLQRNLEKDLWVPHLHHGFAEHAVRSSLHSNVDSVRQLRNRVAHHDSIWAMNEAKAISQMTSVLDLISVEIGDWCRAIANLDEVLTKKPRWLK